ncbi:hypothetical protein [Vibrio sp. ED004]|uniref:hypothetical protein n=1 Tax=Vibrio sp. ED004 TaxID=2785124 RepID=UPI0020BD70C7|nr:hypothetical protein [Vibrio sp. ED004]
MKSTEYAKQAGMKMMTFIILGLGGKEYSAQHVEETAALLNQINPDEIRILSLAVKPGTELMNWCKVQSSRHLANVKCLKNNIN